MNYVHIFKPYLIAVTSITAIPSMAEPIIQIEAGFESSHIIEGLNISNGKSALNLAVDVSFDNNVFTGVDCFKTEHLNSKIGLDHGCHLYLGYFIPIDNEQAVSISLSQNEYANAPRQWDYTQVSLKWHANRSTIITASTIDDWFGRGFKSTALNANVNKPISDRWSASFEAGYTHLNRPANATSLKFARLGIHYGQARWTSELNVYFNDNDLSKLTPFDVKQPEINIRIGY